MFIVLEGLDGAGTTTQTALLVQHLRSRGHQVVSTREPTPGPVGRLIRQTLRGDAEAPSVSTLPWLFAADRAHHLDSLIEPTLAHGGWVVSDRYLHSSLAYQSLTLPLDQVHALNATFRVPDLTVFLDVPVDECLRRIGTREGHAREFYEDRQRLEAVSRQYTAVLKLQRSLGARLEILDGTTSVEQVTAQLIAAVDALSSSE